MLQDAWQPADYPVYVYAYDNSILINDILMNDALMYHSLKPSLRYYDLIKLPLRNRKT